MEKTPSLTKILYHYTTRKNAKEIKKNREMMPSKSGMFLSVNEYGNFDQTYVGKRGNEKWIDGKSEIPNIFLTDTSPKHLSNNPIGVGKKIEDAFEITVEEILNQGLKVYKNPSALCPNFYNIPIPAKRYLKINPNKCISLH